MSAEMRGRQLALAAALLVTMGQSEAIDLFNTDAAVSATPAAALLPGDDACALGPPPRPVALRDAVAHALCGHARTRQVWAEVKVRAAATGAAKAAYLPTATASWQGLRDSQVTHVVGQPQLSSSRKATVDSSSLSLAWVLYDFGAREATLSNAIELLAAARASQIAILQTLFAKVAKDYFDAQAAREGALVAREIERMAVDSFKAASERVSKGVAPISDQLQAQASLAQDVVARTKADSDLQNALGMLADDMGMNPGADLELPDGASDVDAGPKFAESIAQLMEAAQRDHPSVLAAEAQLRAAEAQARKATAQGRPTVELVGKYSRNNQPSTIGLGLPTYPSNGREHYVGVQVTIPLFEGFGRGYLVRQAESQSEEQAATLAETRQKVGLDVWTHFHLLSAATANLRNTDDLLTIARQAFDATRHRYAVGVGNILELLNSQTALQSARKQRVQSLADWRTERVQLAASLGKLGMWDIED